MIDLTKTPQAGEYQCIYADPAWHHVSYSIKGQGRSPSRHYQTMPLDEIRALPVADIAAKNCHLFMWTTQPHLEQSFGVMRDWGFRYSSVFLFWLKLNPRAADEMFLTTKSFHRGMGFTTRKNVEILLLGRRGSPKRLRKDIPDFIIAARRQHSRKPDQAVKAIEDYCVGPRLEMFTRETREGWDYWGNEATKFNEQPVMPPNGNPIITPPALVVDPVPAPLFDDQDPTELEAFLRRLAN